MNYYFDKKKYLNIFYAIWIDK